MSRNEILYLPITIATLLTAGCMEPSAESDGDTDTTDTTGSTAQAIDVIVTPIGIETAGAIGQGRNQITEELRADCVRSANTVTIPLQEASLRFDSSLLKQEASSMLGFSMDAKARFKMISGSARARFSRSLTSNSLSIGMFYVADYRTGIDRIDQASLQWLVDPNAPDWLNRCGDTVLYQRERGGQLYLMYRIDFSSLAARQEFEGSVGVSWPAGSVNTSVQQSASRFVGRASVHVEAFQVGGDVTRLSSVLGGGGPDAAAGRVVLDCSMTNLAPCGAFLQSAINYASSQATGSFSDSLRTTPADRSYLFKDWSILGVPAAVREVPAAVKSARLSLRQRFDAQVELADRIAIMRSGRIFVPAALRPLLDGYDLAVQTNLALLTDAAARCFDLLTDPSSATQLAACTNGATLADLRSRGFDDSITMSSLNVDVRLPYAFGGMYQVTTTGSPRSDVVNPFTGTLGCPAGFTAHVWGVSYVGFRIPLPILVTRYMCLAPDTVAGGGWDFSGAYELTDAGATMVPNTYAGTGGACGGGNGGLRYGRALNGTGTQNYFCSTGARSPQRTTLGGMFTRDDHCGPSYPNPLTGASTCPEGFTEVLVSRDQIWPATCVTSYFVCKAM